jgi:hypothetical protein
MAIRDQILLINAETTPGTYQTLVATDGILCGQFIPTIQEFEEAERQMISGLPGMAEPSVMVSKKASFEIPLEFAGSGTAGTAPGFDKILLACGMVKAVTAGERVTYTMGLTSSTPATRYSLATGIDGQAYRMAGALGSQFQIKLEPNGFAACSATLQGLYVAPVDVANLTPVFAAQASPVTFNSAGVLPGTATVAGFAACINSFSLTLANTQTYRDNAGCGPEMLHANREVSGSITIARPALSGFDAFATAANSTTGAIELPLNGGAGNISTIKLPRVQFKSPKLVDVDGFSYLQMDWVSRHKTTADFPSFVFT